MRACSAQVRDGEIQVWEWVRWLECSVGSEQKNRLREQRVNLNLFIAATTEPPPKKSQQSQRIPQKALK